MMKDAVAMITLYGQFGLINQVNFKYNIKVDYSFLMVVIVFSMCVHILAICVYHSVASLSGEEFVLSYMLIMAIKNRKNIKNLKFMVAHLGHIRTKY